MNNQIKNLDAIILCGGLGSRLRSLINDRPKAMIEFNNRPFLDILIEYIAQYGFRRFILCTGFKGEVIKNYYFTKSTTLKILYSEETEPLGTGGALRRAKSLIKSKTFLVLNGDSFCPINFFKFFDFHLTNKALLSIALTRIKQNRNYGKVKLNNNQQIINFKEKAVLTNNNEYCNVGIYLMEKSIFSFIGSAKKFSLEHELFPTLTGKKCFGYITEKNFIDIGTPKELKKAKNLFSTTTNFNTPDY